MQNEIKNYLRKKSIMERNGQLLFEKIFNEVLGIQVGLPLFFEASTADAKRSRLLKFLS